MRLHRSLRKLLAATALALALPCGTQAADAPSFDCAKARPNTVEDRICGDATLADLDKRMAAVYAQAVTAVKSGIPNPRASQRAWLKSRGQCMRPNAPEPNTCIAFLYRNRIAELLARYSLTPQTGQANLACGKPATRVVIRFYSPPEGGVAIAARGAQAATLYQEQTASGIRYADAAGRIDYVEHQGEAKLTWGNGRTQECRLLK